MGAILNNIEARLHARDQNTGGGNRDLNREGALGMNEVRDDGSAGPHRVHTMDLWRKLEISLF